MRQRNKLHHAKHSSPPSFDPCRGEGCRFPVAPETVERLEITQGSVCLETIQPREKRKVLGSRYDQV